MVASVVVGYLCFVFSPLLLGHTAVYANTWGRPLISCVAGLIFGGLLSLKLLRLGIFCLGACIGILLGMLALYSPLQDESFFSKSYAYDVYYGSFAFVFGVIALFIQQKMLVFATALVGSFMFVLGLDYFVKSGFSAIVETALIGARSQLARQVLHHGDSAKVNCHRGIPNDAYYMLVGWGVLAIICMIVQIKLAQPKDDEIDTDAAQRRRRSQRSNRALLNEVDDDRNEIDMSGWSDTRKRIHSKYRNGGPPTRRQQRRNRRSNEIELDTAPLMGPVDQGNPYMRAAERRQGATGGPVIVHVHQGHTTWDDSPV